VLGHGRVPRVARQEDAVWSVKECLRCGKPLHGDDARLPDGTTRRWYRPRLDMLYCSNACRQAAYRKKKKKKKKKKAASATTSRSAVRRRVGRWRKRRWS